VGTQTVTGAGNALPFTYDLDGLLCAIGASSCTSTANGTLAISRDNAGRLSAPGVTYYASGGNTVDSYTYDGNGLLATYKATYGTNNTLLYSETIVSRDLNGRITERQEQTGTNSVFDWVYGYDSGGRLTTVSQNHTQVSGYGYDADDNRNSVGVTNPTVPTYDAQDRLSTYPALGTSYGYTPNGELQTKTVTVGNQVTNYTYDALGNLLHVGFPSALSDGVQAVDYVIDGQNRRVGRKVTINQVSSLAQGWIYQDQLRPVAQLGGPNGNSVVARYIYGTKANVPDLMTTWLSGVLQGTYRIISDHLGSPRVVVDTATGIAIETITYDEFGNETDSIPSQPAGYQRIPFGFARGLYDPDTQLVRFGARDYDASVGRWTAKDPIRFAGGMNLYRYGHNDPVNRIDPVGLDPDDPTYSDYADWAASLADCRSQAISQAQALFPNYDKQEHCYVTCSFARCSGSGALSLLGGIAHELGWWPGRKGGFWVNWNDSVGDIDADMQGYTGAGGGDSCAQYCSQCPLPPANSCNPSDFCSP
jgi:RHS repeat-associated protein